MPSQPVQPLRIQKTTPTTSPKKPNGSASRPLSELGPMERRRNSPSYNQATRTPLFQSGDSSPFDPSPAGNDNNHSINKSNMSNSSPRLFWQGRDQVSPSRFKSENLPFGQQAPSPSPKKRSSIENLKRASRVKNSNMFAREHIRDYDPTTSPKIERPLAGKSLTFQPKGGLYSPVGRDSPRLDNVTQSLSKMSIASEGGQKLDGITQKMTDMAIDDDSKISLSTPSHSPTKSLDFMPTSVSPSKGRGSPTKSSLSRKHGFMPGGFDPESSTWSDEDSLADRQLPPGRVLHRHAKSVTFDKAPPQINEYEMTTPDASSIGTDSREGSYDSIEDNSFDHGHFEDSFDASLEDTVKTPVVGPEDWRLLSPDVSYDASFKSSEQSCDTARESPRPVSRCGPEVANASPSLSDSTISNGECRPLPPVPNIGSPSLAAAAERAGNAQRALPSPPRPASMSKADVQGLGGQSMSLEDRLRLMMLQDEQNNSPEPESQRNRRLRRGIQRPQGEVASEQGATADGTLDGALDEEEQDDDEPQLPELRSHDTVRPRSAESLLTKPQMPLNRALDVAFSSSPLSSSRGRNPPIMIDPDTPLPSTEVPSAHEIMETSVVVKQESDGEESEVDVYTIPDMYQPNASERQHEQSAKRDSIHEDYAVDEDMESNYSRNSQGEEVVQSAPHAPNDDGIATPRQQSPTRAAADKDEASTTGGRMSLPEFASLLSEDDFGLGLRSYMSPDPPSLDSSMDAKTRAENSLAADIERRPSTPVDQIKSLDETDHESDKQVSESPGSVVRHSPRDATPPGNESTVPEFIATIKAPGGRLKTRPSVTPADMAAMAAARRQVSGELASAPNVPPIPARHTGRPSLGPDELAKITREESDTFPIQGVEDVTSNSESAAPVLEKKTSRRKSLIKLDGPVDDLEADLSIGLDQEFDRLLEAKKRGYLMRQNTKVIVASSRAEEQTANVDDVQGDARGTRSAGNSPRKPSHDRPKSWSVEPWNGKMRRRSIRETPGTSRKTPNLNGPVPPLPGQESAVSGVLDSVAEDVAVAEDEEEVETVGAERGRLFVKVVGVKNLDIPLPTGEQSWFNLTLDNGIHCVQTTWLELSKDAAIGQEFELVVLDDLEFTLTLQTEPPKPPPATAPESPTKAVKAQKPSAFSRVFGSPRKRREVEKKQQEEEQRLAQQKQQEARNKRLTEQASAWELLHNVVAEDGSFGRAYFNLKEHENQAYGRPYNVGVECYNEWATDNSTGSSVRSKHGGIQRRPPYRIGTLELQLLFVPKPKGATDADMPKSLNGCIRELREAESSANRKWEGYLSQQGGDCPYWRRRFFKLDGSKFTAYHESTRQPRATINLAKASKLIDDKSSLMQKEGAAKKGGRRKSAFAEEEEGYMFVEEGFRIRFANGEVIDFYADSAADKDGWMKVLAEAVGKEPGGSGWTAIVLGRENALKTNKSEQTRRQSEPGKPFHPSPRKKAAMAPAATDASPTRRTGATLPPPPAPGPLTKPRGRINAAPKSMVF